MKGSFIASQSRGCAQKSAGHRASAPINPGLRVHWANLAVTLAKACKRRMRIASLNMTCNLFSPQSQCPEMTNAATRAAFGFHGRR